MVTQPGGNTAKRLKTVLEERSLPRMLGPGIALIGIFALLVMLLTGKIDLSSFEVWRRSDETPRDVAKVQPVRLESLGEKSAETIRIATFNLQAFGQEKASDPAVMPVLVKIIALFDVVAIQEVRGGDLPSIQSLLNQLRASGANYSATVSEPIGPAGHTESYAFVWDNSRIHLIEQSAYLVHDSSDRMYREPLVASFECRIGTDDGRRPFRFTLINAHTEPLAIDDDAIAKELNVLDDVFVRVRQYEHELAGEEDCILLGDLNVETTRLRELGQLPNVVSIAGDLKTNAQRTETRDHLLLDRTLTREFTGRFGVVDFQADLGLSPEEASKISDHLPLWAEFSAYEMPRFVPIASQPEPATTTNETALP